MRIDREKYLIARARAGVGQKELEAAGIPKGTLCHLLRHNCRTETAGAVARALGVDVTEILADPEDD